MKLFRSFICRLSRNHLVVSQMWTWQDQRGSVGRLCIGWSDHFLSHNSGRNMLLERLLLTHLFQPISPQMSSCHLPNGHWPPSQQFSPKLFSNRLLQGQTESYDNFCAGGEPEGECYVVPLLPTQPASLPTSWLRFTAGLFFSSIESHPWL